MLREGVRYNRTTDIPAVMRGRRWAAKLDYSKQVIHLGKWLIVNGDHPISKHNHRHRDWIWYGATRQSISNRLEPHLHNTLCLIVRITCRGGVAGIICSFRGCKWWLCGSIVCVDRRTCEKEKQVAAIIWWEVIGVDVIVQSQKEAAVNRVLWDRKAWKHVADEPGRCRITTLTL